MLYLTTCCRSSLEVDLSRSGIVRAWEGKMYEQMGTGPWKTMAV